MNLDLFNNILNNAKENNFIKNFMEEISNYLEKANKNLSNDNIKESSLKQENCLYQVVDMDKDGVYLQNTNNNQVSKENEISQELLNKIGNDTVLRYQNEEYIIEEGLTQKFFDSLVDIKEYKEIQEKFINESNILEIDSNTRYKIEMRDKDYCILSYKDDEKNTIKVPNALIPFWATNEESLYYKNGKFCRDI